jgi:hypothetical protein
VVCRCSLCFSVTRNRADYAVSFGKRDLELQVCRWCRQDLFGVQANLICVDLLLLRQKSDGKKDLSFL